MRLIDADTLMERIADISNPDMLTIGKVIGIIDTQPTAYDIDKVAVFYSSRPIEDIVLEARAEAEEEAENRFNRVLDDEKRISYEQGRKNERENIMDIVYNAKDDAHAMFLLGQHFMIEQLKEGKK